MSTSYSPLLYLGKSFDDQSEAEEFYKQYIVLSEDDLELIEEDGFNEFMYGQKEISGSILNHYSGYGYILGIDLSYPKPSTFHNDYAKAITTWQKYFKDETYDLIHEVCVS